MQWDDRRTTEDHFVQGHKSRSDTKMLKSVFGRNTAASSPIQTTRSCITAKKRISSFSCVFLTYDLDQNTTHEERPAINTLVFA